MRCALAFRASGPSMVRVGCVHGEGSSWRAFVASSQRLPDGTWRTDQAEFDVGRPTRDLAVRFALDVLLPSFHEQGMDEARHWQVRSSARADMARELLQQGAEQAAAVILLGQAPHEEPDRVRLQALAAHDPAQSVAQAAARVAKRKAAAQAREQERPAETRGRKRP